MTHDRQSTYARRDRVIAALCNGLLHLASRRYRDMINGAIRYGMRSAARDSIDGRRPPEPWEVLARARKLTELRCECENPERNAYTGRDGKLHCDQCDGLVMHRG